MTAKTKNEVKCLSRLQEMSPIFEELIQFLQTENLISEEELKVVRLSPETAKELQKKLATLSQKNELQLLEYMWEILPVERIRITIVSNRNGVKEFEAEF